MLEQEPISESIRRITLNRPGKRNALNRPLRWRISQSVREAEADGIEVIIFEGEGKSFCSGADLDEPEEVASETDAWVEMVKTCREFSGIIIGKLHGHVIGGGNVLAIGFDIRHAAEGTVFQIPEVLHGYTLDPFTYKLLPLVLGEGVARELILTGRQFSAKEAKQLGYLTGVHPADELESIVLEQAKFFVEEVPSEGITLNKRGMNEAFPLG